MGDEEGAIGKHIGEKNEIGGLGCIEESGSARSDEWVKGV